MTEIKDEVYSTIFSALKHGVRRRILWMLAEGQKSFTNLYESLEITSSHLNYHLESLGELVSKEEGSYRLSVFGRAAVDMMRNIESPPKLGVLSFEQNKYRAVTTVLVMLLVTVSGLLVNEFRVPENTHNMGMGDPIGMASLDLFPGESDLIKEAYSDSGVSIMKRKQLDYRYMAKWVYGESYSAVEGIQNAVMVFYVPVENTTMNLIVTKGYMQDIVDLPITIQRGDALNNESVVLVKEGYIKEHHYKVWQSEIVWATNSTGGGYIYDIPIQDSGWYTLCLTGPIELSGSDPTVRYMWGKREKWVDIKSIYVNAVCNIQKDGSDIMFAVKDKEITGASGWWIGDLLETT